MRNFSNIPSTSDRVIYIELQDDFSPIKAHFIKILNSRQLKYKDMINYYATLYDGNTLFASSVVYDIIGSLKRCADLRTSLLSELCEFMKLDLVFVDKEPK